MARLHEHQGKALLHEQGLLTPRGSVAREAEDARRIASQVLAAGARGVVLKIQAWTTGRKAMGGVAFAKTPDEAREHAARLLAMTVGEFPVEEVLVEEMLDIRHELFVSLMIDDSTRAPAILLSLEGGTGIEERGERVHRLAVSPGGAVDGATLRKVIAESKIEAASREGVASAVEKIAACARKHEARSLEVNPLVVVGDGRVMAADCRVAIDDYAVFRHPDLRIGIARELDHPPTDLERIAYRIENADHRGTFFFARLPTSAKEGAPGSQPPPRVIGFHGAGGGGSMMSLDAISNAGFTPANFTDTSGNPSAAKVYAAARIILSQPTLLGYFGSGSGVASQEQHWSAYGVAKAFLEVGLDVPAVIRMGGNSEDRAVEILQDSCKGLPARVEGYRKDDTPAKIASRFRELVDAAKGKAWTPRPRKVPAFVGKPGALSFELKFGKGGADATWGGRVWIDVASCTPGDTAALVRDSGGVLRDEGGKPALAVSAEEAAGKDSEMIACEIERRRAGRLVVFVDLPIPGIDDAPGGGRA